jgi:MoCo/4Fe-4S cofactor protein with predicted Tat translocation signal
MTVVPPRSEGVDLPVLPQRPGHLRGRPLWRSLEELAETAEFRELVEREFPSQLAVWDDPRSRRDFLRLMAAPLALAGVTGCMRPPQETIVPSVQYPEQSPARPLYFATAISRGGYGLGVLAQSHAGRPTKIEGNPLHPASLGATDVFAQASILDLYDPDRSQTVLHRGVIQTWDRFLTMLAGEAQRLTKQRGAGLCILTETVTSPTLGGQLLALADELPEARWHQFEAANLDNVHAGCRLAFGRDVDVRYRFDRADIVVALDADFLSELPGSVRYARDFIDRRRVAGGNGRMNRLYALESTPTITGAMADHRLPLRPTLIESLARLIYTRLKSPSAGATDSTLLPGVSAKWLAAVMSDLAQHRGRSLVIAGSGQPPAVHALALAINNALGNLGQTLALIEPVEARPEDQLDSLKTLIDEMRGGQVETLVILGGNPVYAAPGELDFTSALARVPLRMHLADYEDETSFLCDWHVPAAHALESWSDVRGFDGTATIIQPLIEPLYSGRTAHELVAILRGQTGQTSHQLVQAHWQSALPGDDFARTWRRALHDGVVARSESREVQVELKEEALAVGSREPDVGSRAGSIEIEWRPDPTVWDGRFANNGWLQELPKPLTKITWDNAALVSALAAERLGVQSGDVLEISLGERSIRAPAWIMPGQPDDCVSLTLGYGRTRSGRIGTGIGYRAAAILPTQSSRFVSGASIRKTAERHLLATTQRHHNIAGGDIVRFTSFADFQADPDRLHRVHEAELPTLFPGYEYTGHAWGMVIDQTACIGCNACMVACQAENNVPIVGREQVHRAREMHWLRIDRYYYGPLESPQTHFQPMMCVHCEQAPCEVVCPVAATVHDSEGTNNMIYNRCVGTRYCSNNCPYKVRRFNFLQYTDEATPSLKLLRNPEVTVRSRGVMEKCTYCIQRISAARIAAKRDERPIRDGDIVTACQQACPTRAIHFGDLNDSQSEVHGLKRSPLNYGVLAELNTRPRTTHLARVLNPHPDLAASETQS